MAIFQSEYELRVSFEDLDPLNIVWHGNYMRYLEQARCDMHEKLGYSYLDMKRDDVAFPIAKMNVKYIKPATLGDILVIKLNLIALEPTFEIKYVIYNKSTGDKIFEAYTMQIAVNIETKESIYTPPIGLIKAIEGCKNEKI